MTCKPDARTADGASSSSEALSSTPPDLHRLLASRTLPAILLHYRASLCITCPCFLAAAQAELGGFPRCHSCSRIWPKFPRHIHLLLTTSFHVSPALPAQVNNSHDTCQSRREWALLRPPGSVHVTHAPPPQHNPHSDRNHAASTARWRFLGVVDFTLEFPSCLPARSPQARHQLSATTPTPPQTRLFRPRHFWRRTSHHRRTTPR
jgi:hypothetical protein